MFQSCELLENRPQTNEGLEKGVNIMMEDVTENLGGFKKWQRCRRGGTAAAWWFSDKKVFRTSQKNQVHGNGAALARCQGMEEQVAVLSAVPASVNYLIAM